MSKLTYIRCGDYDIPNLKLSEQPETSIGKYGRMRKSYLKEHRPILYNHLLMSGKLYPHLLEIDRTAQERVDTMLPHMMETAGVTEELKACVPIGIEEAARIDGANKLQVFVRIVLPLVSPGIVATAIYVFINAWNEYLYSMILMSSSDKTTISVAVKTLEGADILNWGALMAACAIVVVPSIIFFCFIQNKMAGGLSDGAVK